MNDDFAKARTHNDAFGRLLKRCEGLQPVTCAIAHPCDSDSLLGPIEAAKRGLITSVLVARHTRRLLTSTSKEIHDVCHS